jgi:hypothetical protein
MTTFTENGAPAYSSTNSNLMDLFITGVRNADLDKITDLCSKAFDENRVYFIALICLTRDPRNGKGEKQIAYAMLKWLKNNHEKLYYDNILHIAQMYGKFSDLLKITNKHDKEIQLFAGALQEDPTKDKPSLAAKWAPRESNDKLNAKNTYNSLGGDARLMCGCLKWLRSMSVQYLEC